MVAIVQENEAGGVKETVRKDLIKVQPLYPRHRRDSLILKTRNASKPQSSATGS